MTQYAEGFKVHENLLPSNKCPVCGQRFFRRCRRSEWGFWSDSMDGKIYLFCSAKCADKFDRERFLQSCRDTLQTKSFLVWKKVHDGKSVAQVREEFKSSDRAIRHMVEWIETMKFREVEWLEAHNWEVAG